LESLNGRAEKLYAVAIWALAIENHLELPAVNHMTQSQQLVLVLCTLATFLVAGKPSSQDKLAIGKRRAFHTKVATERYSWPRVMNWDGYN